MRRVAVAATLALACALAPAATAAEPPPGEAGWMYEPSRIAIVDLTLAPAEQAELEAEPGEYVKGGFAIYEADPVTGERGAQVGPTLNEVGLRLKGNIEGSFRTLDEKPGLKIKFKEFDDPKFQGLKKMTFNNMVQDSSMLHEALSYAIFRQFGVAAPRTGYAEVWLNGEDLGVYANIENLDDVGLERWFGEFDDPQHLYEGEYGVDVEPGRAGEYEVDEGDDEYLGDLEALIAAVNAGSGAGWSSLVEPVADLREMTRMWAVEKYAGQWDGYAGLDSPERPNNYYLYGNSEGIFRMLPWGTDQALEDPLPFEGDGGLMFDRCLEDAVCAGYYREALAELGSLLSGMRLGALASCLAGELAPLQARESDARREYDGEEIAAGVAALDSYIEERPADLANWLASHPSPTAPSAVGTPTPCGPDEESETEEEGGGTEEEGGGSGEPAASSAAAGVAPGPASNAAVQSVGVRTRNGVLWTVLRLRRPARARQLVALRLRHRTIRACRVESRSLGAGRAVLRCRLSQQVRRHLRRRWLKLRVALRVQAPDDPSRTIRSTVLAPRFVR